MSEEYPDEPELTDDEMERDERDEYEYQVDSNGYDNGYDDTPPEDEELEENKYVLCTKCQHSFEPLIDQKIMLCPKCVTVAYDELVAELHKEHPSEKKEGANSLQSSLQSLLDLGKLTAQSLLEQAHTEFEYIMATNSIFKEYVTKEYNESNHYYIRVFPNDWVTATTSPKEVSALADYLIRKYTEPVIKEVCIKYFTERNVPFNARIKGLVERL